MPGTRKSTLRSVAMPAEHGGWGLTLEPGLLGVLLAPSLAGLLLGVAALLSFLLRTPMRLVLRRYAGSEERRTTTVGQERTRVATRVAAVELLAIGLSLAGAAVLAEDSSWIWPLAVAAPLFAVAFWFDLRSASRHVIAEIAGSVAVAAVAAMAALAGGASEPLAIGAWLILSARVFTSIPHVRAQIHRIHGREAPGTPTLIGDLAALATAAAAVVLEASLIVGAIAIVVLVVVQRITLVRPARPAKILGVRQMVLGFAVVLATAIGAWLL